MPLCGPVRLCDGLTCAGWYVGMGRRILWAYTGVQRLTGSGACGWHAGDTYGGMCSG